MKQYRLQFGAQDIIELLNTARKSVMEDHPYAGRILTLTRFRLAHVSPKAKQARIGEIFAQWIRDPATIAEPGVITENSHIVCDLLDYMLP